jgi:hypothetical protein
MKKFVFYDDSIKNDKLLLDSLHNNIQKYHVTQDSTINELLDNIDFYNIEYLGFLFHYQGANFVPFFCDEMMKQVEPIENNDNLLHIHRLKIHEPKYYSFSDTFVDFLKTIRNNSGVSFVVDILSCDFNSETFKKDAQKLEEELDIVIRYSVDQKGNSPQGNWIMESHDVNVKDLYFIESIHLWNGILSDEIQVAQITDIKTSDGLDVFSVTTSGAYTIYSLLLDINWNSDLSGVNASTNFIRLDASNVIFDGQGYTITIPSGITYSGLFIPSIRSDAGENNPVLIRNLQINNNSNLGISAGGIVRETPSSNRLVFRVENCSYHQVSGTMSFFAGGIAGINCGGYNGLCIIENCYSTCTISGNNAGGIAGTNAGAFDGKCIIQNCYSIGNISGSNAGGIAGTNAGAFDGKCIIQNCYSTGNFTGINAVNDAGGIAGAYAGQTNGNCIIQNCYSTGNINIIGGSYAGGIVGLVAGYANGKCIIQNCYSTGIIGGFQNGGIVGGSPGENGKCIIQNCYSTGMISGNGTGGIAGGLAGFLNGICIIQNSYSSGIIDGNNSGGIAGNEIFNCIIQNCYSVNGSGSNPQSYTSGFANGNFDINDISFGLINNLIDASSISLNDGLANTIILDNSYGLVRISTSNTQYYSEVRNSNSNGINGFITTLNNFPRLQAFQRIPWNDNNYTTHNSSGVYINDLSQLITQSENETNNNKILNKQNVQNYYGLLTNITTTNILINNVLQQGNVTKENVIYFLLNYTNNITITSIELQTNGLLIDNISNSETNFILQIDNNEYELVYDNSENILKINNTVYGYVDNPKTTFILNNITFQIVATGSLLIEGDEIIIPSDCDEKLKIKETFCNVFKTEKKAIVFNKPKNNMTRKELLSWASKNKYR